MESPLVYAYRTKITPHFERPPKWAKKDEVKPGEQPPWLKIGFNMTNSNSTLDIEVCQLLFSRPSTSASTLRLGMPHCDAGVE